MNQLTNPNEESGNVEKVVKPVEGTPEKKKDAVSKVEAVLEETMKESGTTKTMKEKDSLSAERTALNELLEKNGKIFPKEQMDYIFKRYDCLVLCKSTAIGKSIVEEENKKRAELKSFLDNPNCRNTMSIGITNVLQDVQDGKNVRRDAKKDFEMVVVNEEGKIYLVDIEGEKDVKDFHENEKKYREARNDYNMGKGTRANLEAAEKDFIDVNIVTENLAKKYKLAIGDDKFFDVAHDLLKVTNRFKKEVKEYENPIEIIQERIDDGKREVMEGQEIDSGGKTFKLDSLKDKEVVLAPFRGVMGTIYFREGEKIYSVDIRANKIKELWVTPVEVDGHVMPTWTIGREEFMDKLAKMGYKPVKDDSADLRWVDRWKQITSK